MNIVYERQIESLYLSMYKRLYIYSRCTFESDSLAEEAVQETFRIACMKPEAVCCSPNPEGWLVVTLKNVISNMRRTQDSAVRLLAEVYAQTGESSVMTEDHLALSVLYGDLANTEEFQLIQEFALEGKSHLELAQERGITVAACKKRVQRAKEFLQKKIKI